MRVSKRKLLEIRWVDPGSDWEWFWQVRRDGDWYLLKGADDPKTGAPHNGDYFMAHRMEMRSVKEVKR